MFWACNDMFSDTQEDMECKKYQIWQYQTKGSVCRWPGIEDQAFAAFQTHMVKQVPLQK